VICLADTVGSMRRSGYLLGLATLLAGSGCVRKHELFPELDAGGSNDAQTDAAPPYVVSDGGVVYCGKRPCACSNGVDDDDDDELIDGFDPECTGPYDDDEASFATGEIKDGNRRCSDCFFDGNPGYDDGCRIPTSCVLTGNASNAGGNCNSCTPSAKCVDSCLSLTPNGCDCFGCCEIQDGMQSFAILLADTCSMAVLADETKCPRCVLTPDGAPRCYNPCGRCELCPGKTQSDLPADCGGDYDCEDADLCGSTNALCPGLAWCIQGCCAPILY
jgi:hypothetical protein